jgi:hypothetical protein
LSSSPPGEAVIGFLWYEKGTNEEWQIINQGNISIGHGHTSYSAEAIAIILGLQNDPGPVQSSEQVDVLSSGQESLTEDAKTDGIASKDTRVLSTSIQEHLPQAVIPDEETSHLRVPLQRYDIGIFTDSLSNIETIRKGIAQTKDQQLLLKTIANHNCSITIQHVRGHRNIIRNNEADKICNIKSNRSDRTRRHNLIGLKTKSKIKAWTKSWTSNRRLRNIRKNKRAKKRKSATRTWMCRTTSEGVLIPRPKFFNSMPRRKGVLLAKARTNRWTACNWYLHYIKDKHTSSPLCTSCGVKDTLQHVIDNCQLHEEHREQTLRRLGHTGKMSDLLCSSDTKAVSELAEFLVKTEDNRIDRRKQVTDLLSQNQKETLR